MAKVTVYADLVMHVGGTGGGQVDTNLVAFKFSLPSIVGTVTGARLHMNVYSRDTPAVSNLVSKTSLDNTWNSASSGADIVAIGMTAGIETIVAGSLPASGDVSWDVHTTGANSIDTAYAGTPGSFTVVIDSNATTSTASTRQETSSIEFAEDSTTYIALLDGPTDATPPYLEIEYTPAAGGDTEQFFKFF